MTSAHDLLDLVRAPAVLSVLGDTLAGAAAAGRPATGRRALLPLASACLYAGGMALNDWADRAVDAVERPERPIPSGRITPGAALAVAGGLGVAGLALAAAGGGRGAFAVAVPLAGAVWAYDAVLKDTAAGPVAMAACRGLDVLMGAGAGHLRAALPAAAGLAAHTAGVTVLSRGEVHGTRTPVAGAVAAGTGAVASAALAAGLRAAGRGRTRGAALLTGAGAVAYLATCLPPQLAAARRPGAGEARDATRAGIRAMLPLQATWVAASGGRGGVAVLAGVAAVGRLTRARAARHGAGLSET